MPEISNDEGRMSNEIYSTLFQKAVGERPREPLKPKAHDGSRATVLVGKVEVWIFKETVHQDNEFTHDGGEGDEGFFAVGPEALVTEFKNAVVSDGA